MRSGSLSFKINVFRIFFWFSQPDGYNCGCGQGYTCQRYGSNYYWGKCVASCSSDSSCKKTECCSGRRCKLRKGAGKYCPRKGVIKLFFLNQSFIFIFQRYEFTFSLRWSRFSCSQSHSFPLNSYSDSWTIFLKIVLNCLDFYSPIQPKILLCRIISWFYLRFNSIFFAVSNFKELCWKLRSGYSQGKNRNVHLPASLHQIMTIR